MDKFFLRLNGKYMHRAGETVLFVVLSEKATPFTRDEANTILLELNNRGCANKAELIPVFDDSGTNIDWLQRSDAARKRPTSSVWIRGI